MYAWIYINFTDLDGDAYIEQPLMFKHYRDAKKKFDEAVRRLYDYVEEEDIIQQIKEDNYLHISTEDSYFTIYIKKKKIIDKYDYTGQKRVSQV